MVEKIEMYGAVCDGCKDIMEIYDGTVGLTEADHVKDAIYETEWSLLEDGKCYCPKCHTVEWDDENDYQLAKDTNGKLLGKIEG